MHVYYTGETDKEIIKLFIHPHPIVSEEVKMGEKIQPKGGIYEVKFGYHSKMSGYTTLM